MTADVALGSDDVTKLGVGLTVALIVVAVLIVLVVKALVVRVVTLLIAVVLAVLVWQQREHVRNAYNTHACNLNATYFGIQLDAPADVQRACRASSNGR